MNRKWKKGIVLVLCCTAMAISLAEVVVAPPPEVSAAAFPLLIIAPDDSQYA